MRAEQEPTEDPKEGGYWQIGQRFRHHKAIREANRLVRELGIDVSGQDEGSEFYLAMDFELFQITDPLSGGGQPTEREYPLFGIQPIAKKG